MDEENRFGLRAKRHSYKNNIFSRRNAKFLAHTQLQTPVTCSVPIAGNAVKLYQNETPSSNFTDHPIDLPFRSEKNCTGKFANTGIDDSFCRRTRFCKQASSINHDDAKKSRNFFFFFA